MRSSTDMRVDGTGDAVLHLQVQLRDGVAVVDAGVTHVTLGGGVDHVADEEALDGLVLGNGARTVAAAHVLDVATSLTVLAAVASLLGHTGQELFVYELGALRRELQAPRAAGPCAAPCAPALILSTHVIY